MGIFNNAVYFFIYLMAVLIIKWDIKSFSDYFTALLCDINTTKSAVECMCESKLIQTCFFFFCRMTTKSQRMTCASDMDWTLRRCIHKRIRSMFHAQECSRSPCSSFIPQSHALFFFFFLMDCNVV